MTFLRTLLAFYRRHTFVLSAIVIIIILRAALLLITPPGFYVDEAASGAHVISLLAHGSNANGENWPLFSRSLGGGYTTPIYLYPLAAWSLVFGTSEYALRAFSLLATIITSLLLALAVRLWLGNKAAFIAALGALLLPWSLIQGSLAWDPALVPVFIAGSLYSLAITQTTTSARQRLLAASTIGICLVALAYLYPPCRVTAPLLLAVMYGILLYQKRLTSRATLVIAFLLAVLCLPLLAFMIQPDALNRSAALSVFHDTTAVGGLIMMLSNFIAMLNPIFLFITGDANLRHATGQQGMLGLATLPPLLTLLYIGICRLLAYRDTRDLAITPTISLLSLACVGIILSILGSALTAEGQPHSLRATAAWPFFVILITIGWIKLLALPQVWLRRSALVIALLATSWYLIDFAFYYPDRSAAAFDVPARQAITSHSPDNNYPALAKYYYEHK